MQELFAHPLFLAVADSGVDTICVLQPDGVILFVNAVARQIYKRLFHTDQVGAEWASLWPAEGAELAAKAVVAAANGECAEFRMSSSTCEGHPAYWTSVVSPVHDSSGHVVALVAKSRDVTLEIEQKAVLAAIVEHAPAAITVKDVKDGRFRLVNKALEDLTGLVAEEMIGRTDYDIFPPSQADFFRAKDRELLERDEAIIVEQEPIATADGSERILRTKKVVVRDQGRPSYILCVSEDITDDLQTAERLKSALNSAEFASRAKTEFLANMSHEIRTPLNGVMGVAGALARTQLSPTQQEMVSLIETSAKTLETLLSDILDLARIEAGKMELRPEPFDLLSSVRACADLFDAAAQAKGLDLSVEITPEALGGYVGDAARIRQILSNLLGNAIKFTSVGKVNLRVSATRLETSSELRFEVHDTGIGFDAETKARLFARFEQADGSITRRFGGSGLGLSISRSLAEALGGRLDAHAKPGEGSVFTLTLQLPRCPDELKLQLDDAEAAGPGDPLSGLRVLLAEDHPTNRRVVELVLGAAGVDLTCVENGVEAVDTFRREGFDLILMDMQMPVMDGLTAIAEIRKIEAASSARRTPIHVLTANAMPEHISASLAAGADGHLSKPILADLLLQRVSDVGSMRRVSMLRRAS